MWSSSSPVPGTSPSLSRNLLATFKEYSGFDLVYQLVGDLEMPIWLPDEAQSAEFAIHLFAEDISQSIPSLFDCQGWGTKCRICAHSCNPASCMSFLIAEWGTCGVSNWFRLYCFHTIFHVFSWTFLPCRPLSCLSPGDPLEHNFFFLSYI